MSQAGWVTGEVAGRWLVSAVVAAWRPYEDAHLIMMYEGEVIAQDDLRIPLRVEVRDSSDMGWFSVHLLVRWTRYPSDDDSFILLELREASLIPDHPEYPVPTAVLGDQAWWGGVLDATEQHLFSTAKDFDPGYRLNGPPNYGWASEPITPPTRGELIDRRPLDTA